MGQISTAIGSERVAKVVGYELQKGDFSEVTPNLPMRIAVLGQANTDKQTGLTNAPVEVTSEQQAGQLFGFGSQIHGIMRVLRSRFGDLVGGIPTVVYPQLPAGGGVAEIQEITVTSGPADKNGFITLRINGRTSIDGESYIVDIAKDDAVADVATKIAAVINASQSCPVSAVATLGVVACTAKWVGEATTGLVIEVDTGDDDLALAYAVAQDTAGTGSSATEVTSSLALFGNEWNTIVINPYDPATTNSLFEDVNGVPGQVPATGRYAAALWKPFVVLQGDLTSDTVANVIAGLDKDEATIVQCPAPNSDGWAFEAAANVAVLLARQAQDNPHLDVSGKNYPDMPVPADQDAGIFTNYNDRDAIVKGGASTVIIKNSKYYVEDLVTTYHPDGEVPPQFRYVRSLIQDWNVRYGYFLLEELNVIDKSIAQDSQSVSVLNTIKPKQWIQVLRSYADDLAERNLIIDPDFMKDGLVVGTNDNNPDRLETSFKYKRSPFARIASTTATAGFGFGL